MLQSLVSKLNHSQTRNMKLYHHCYSGQRYNYSGYSPGRRALWQPYNCNLAQSGFGITYSGRPLSILTFLYLAHQGRSKIPGTVVISGLLTARVCRDHFTNVLISWTQVNKRSRVLQYESLQASDNASPLSGPSTPISNFNVECSESGIPSADLKTHIRGRPYLVPHDAYKGGLPKTIFASRRALETIIRRLTLGGQKSGDDGYVSTVTIRKHGEHCTGPAICGLKWLRRATGQDVASLKVSYDPKMYYTSTYFTVPPDLAARLPIPGVGITYRGGHIHVMSPDPSQGCHNHLAVAKVEHNQIVICFGGWGMERPVHAIDDIKDHVLGMASDVPIPEWFMTFLDMLKEIEDTRTYSPVRIPPSFFVHYEKTAGIPPNFIAIGDSVCRVNSIFGQGCSKALIGAAALNTLLLRIQPSSRGNLLPKNFSRQFFTSQASKINYGNPTTVPIAGERLDSGALMWRNVMMIDTVWIDFFQPFLLLKVLWQVTKEHKLPSLSWLGRIVGVSVWHSGSEYSRRL
ncbi:hypothetical protein CPB85DRAFT_1297187 [Mucidula mucida]|nr:hypothetical protein CPB85DRAFT_1297187 [Mucidula mucida]